MAGIEPLYDEGDELTKKDEDAYTIAHFIDRGGTGEVYRLSSNVHGSNRAFKLYIPFYFLDRLGRMGMGGPEAPDITSQVFRHFETLQISEGEYRTLAQLNHPYIASVHDLIRVSLPPKALQRLRDQYGLDEDTRSSFGIISAYVDGRGFVEFSKTAGTKALFTALTGVAQALDYLNLEARVLHCDIKASNVLVRRSDSLPVIVDFGLAQDADTDSERMIAVATQLLPTESHVPGADEIRRRLVRDELVSKRDFLDAYYPWLDRYQFGLLLREAAREATALSSSDREYLDYVAGHLTNKTWLEDHADEPMADLVERVDANRVYPLVRTGARAEDLQIPSPGRPITVSGPLVRLARHPSLVRLNRQSQLGLLPARFPGARHSRYLHSLDVYRLTRAFARKLLDVPRFRAEMAEEDVTHLLVAALFHDINHLPFLHVFQEVSEDKGWLPDPLEVVFAYATLGSGTLEAVLTDAGLTREELLLRVRPDRSSTCEDSAVTIVHSLLDSGVDMDKLSYLQLDASHSGLGFGADIEVNGLFSAADVAPLSHPCGTYAAGTLVVCYPEEALDVVEGVIRARVEAFESLYWCDENRAMMAAFAQSVLAVMGTDDGPRVLADLIRDSVSMSDDEFLRRLDRLAVDLAEHPFEIRSFFDGAWTSLARAGTVHDPTLLASLRRLNAGDRAGYEERVVAALGLNGTSPVLVDLPGRDLDLGGPVFVRAADGRARDGSHDSRFKPYVDRLRALSNRISLFVPTDALSLIGGSDADRDEAFRRAPVSAKSTDNWS